MNKDKLRTGATNRACQWQGYGGGAAYEDLGCSGGQLVDLDACDEPGGSCAFIGEPCPNCLGDGMVSYDHKDLGPMARVRKRAHEELAEDIRDMCAEDDRGSRDEALRHILDNIDQLFQLVDKLETPRRAAGGAS